MNEIQIAARNTKKYSKIEVMSGLALLIAFAAGIILANSRFGDYYERFINFPLNIDFWFIHTNKSILFWVNDGLVSLFFLLIGLEIKREVLEGELSQKSHLILPCSAAIAGLIVPALIYTFFNYDNPINMRGWAIPTAMDTAFALGVLALLGNKFPASLRIFLMALAIIDDILAVLVIALFYADELSQISILASTFIFGILVILNQSGVARISVYMLLGFLLWLFVLNSGVHTSVAGVLVAFAVPLKNGSGHHRPAFHLEKMIHPWVAFGILPLFAFTNAGVSLETFKVNQLLDPLALGIMWGLFLGKQLGIFGATLILVKSNIVPLPRGSTWVQVYGVSVLCGIGFTMSLFIGALSFESGGPKYDDLVKISVFFGSIVSAIVGYIILKLQKNFHEARVLLLLEQLPKSKSK